MKSLPFLFLCFIALASFSTKVTAACFQFTQEHVDLLSITWDASAKQLGLVASDDSHGYSYASNECVVLCPESMKFTIPGGTPLGDEGDSLWILPQNPYAGVPYVGVSSEQITAGVFNDPLTIRLTRLEGPGQFLVWQAGTLGGFDVKMDTRDGINVNDSLTIPVGGHAHYNWGFATSGVYRAYFQAEGRLLGADTNILSAVTPFTFHILPLRPFELWTATNWPCECATNIIAASADPDGDKAVNAFEYATGTDPKEFTTNAGPVFNFVLSNNLTYGAMTFTRAKSATDATCEAFATGALGLDGWQPMTNTHAIIDLGSMERVTVRDNTPTNCSGRFYELRVSMPRWLVGGG
jgi:surface-anchored protein